jgi:arabinogalactan endo-1,4-beta-galactosidase
MLPLYIFSVLLAGVQASLTYKGVDWSSVVVEENAGYTYKNTAGTTQVSGENYYLFTDLCVGLF